MPTGISHNFLIDWGVMVNIPDAFREVELTLKEKGNLADFKSQNPFILHRIVIDFSLRDPNKADPGAKVCIPASIIVFIEQADLEFRPFDLLNIADWDGSRWNRLTLNLERWEFPVPIRFKDVEYVGYIKADTCIAGDPPIAVGE